MVLIRTFPKIILPLFSVSVSIPVNSEAVSTTTETTKRVQTTLTKCLNNNDLTDTFTIDHLLRKLNSENVRVLSCTSPMVRVGLPYIQKYLKKSHICEKNILCIPLCDILHIQGYVVDNLKKEKIHIDSLRPANGKYPVSAIIARVLFKQKEVRFKSYFMTRVQFDSNSYVLWLIAAMAAYVHSLPKSSVRNDAFDIAISLFERKKEFRDGNVESEAPSSENWKSEDHINIYTSAKFLIDVLKNSPTNSPFYTEVLPKGIRSNYFYITDTTKCPMS